MYVKNIKVCSSRESYINYIIKCKLYRNVDSYIEIYNNIVLREVIKK